MKVARDIPPGQTLSPPLLVTAANPLARKSSAATAATTTTAVSTTSTACTTTASTTNTRSTTSTANTASTTIKQLMQTSQLMQQLPPLSKFSGELSEEGETFEDWLSQFEMVSSVCGWDTAAKLALELGNISILS